MAELALEFTGGKLMGASQLYAMHRVLQLTVTSSYQYAMRQLVHLFLQLQESQTIHAPPYRRGVAGAGT